MNNKIRFAKMHGLGNDFVFVGSPNRRFEPNGELAKELCHRKYGVGADGLVVVSSSQKGDYRMRIFNPDGFEAEMCGNALRCSAKYVFDSGYSEKTDFLVETAAGCRRARVTENGAECSLGVPELLGTGTVVLEGKRFEYRHISMGNPHCVIFCHPMEEELFLRCGAAAEHHPLFPEGVNAEFCTVLNESELSMRVWERGVGETLSCATGAGAAAFCAFSAGFCKNSISVRQPGGDLKILVSDKGEVFASGECRLVFRGEF